MSSVEYTVFRRKLDLILFIKATYFRRKEVIVTTTDSILIECKVIVKFKSFNEM